jgi:arsenite methyltransferase
MTSPAERAPDELATVRERVRVRYAGAARTAASGGIPFCGESCGDEGEPQDRLYSGAEQDEVPEEAVLASLGCGNPVAVADLREGETVLDLGSGGGIDVLLSARRVGPAGRAYGLDMTEEMLSLARANASRAGAANVEFLQGHIEAIPMPDAAVDVIISNCVINLSADKPAVFTESYRVLRRGGRIGVSDILAEDHLTPAERAERGEGVGCIAGAPSFREYRDGLARAGFTGIGITPTDEVAAGMHSAIIRAVKPQPPCGRGHRRPGPERHDVTKSQEVAALCGSSR